MCVVRGPGFKSSSGQEREEAILTSDAMTAVIPVNIHI